MDPSTQNRYVSDVPTAPVSPVAGSVGKEAEPVKQAASIESPTAPEVAKPVEKPVELAPTVPEVTVEKGLENVVEKSPDADKPQLAADVKAAGVTFSGPGIPVDENVFGVTKLPMTYAQAAEEEKLHPKLNDSKRWLSDLVMYVWRKIDPTLGKKGHKEKDAIT